MNGKNQRRRERRAFARQLCDKINTFQADQIAEVLAIAANNESIATSLTKRYLLLLQFLNPDVPFGLKHLEHLPDYLQSFQELTEDECYEFQYYFDVIGFYVLIKQLSVAADLVRNYAPSNMQELNLQYCHSKIGTLLIGVTFYQHLAETEQLPPLPDLDFRRISILNSENMLPFTLQTKKIEARHCSNLESFDIDNVSHIQHFEPSHLLSLKRMMMHRVQLHDMLSFISFLPKINHINFLSITNLTDLPNFRSDSLQELTIDAIAYTPIPLSEIVIDFPHLPHLQNLSISCYNVLYIGNIRQFAQLKKLELSCAKLQDIEAISNFTQLEELRLLYLKISDINFVKHLPNLKKLSLDHNNITDITPLSSLPLLDLLSLSNNNIEHISPLTALTDLRILYLRDNNIKDISPLSKLIALQYLRIDNNKIEDISPLLGLKKLVSLECSNNNIDDITVVLSINPQMDLNAKNNKLTAFPSFELIRQIILQKKNMFKIRRPGDPEIVLPPRPEPESAREIWNLLRTKDPANIELAKQIAVGIGWQKEDLEPYLFIVNKWF
jgi:Leucine-rich repeat (LRR) protein